MLHRFTDVMCCAGLMWVMGGRKEGRGDGLVIVSCMAISETAAHVTQVHEQVHVMCCAAFS